MCVNAGTSLAVAAVVGAVGVLSVRSVREPRECVLATLPLAFAAHQAAEGVTWIRLGSDADGTCAGPSVVMWALFAWALVPLWLGGGVTLVERSTGRRRVMWVMVVAGASAAPWQVANALSPNLVARVVEGHVHYAADLTPRWIQVPYLVALLGPPLLSSWPWLRVIGVLGVLSGLLAVSVSMPGAPSLWCLAAAWLSVGVLLHLRSAHPHPSTVPEQLPTPARGG